MGETLSGPVLVVGTGLIGTSIGLALRRAGAEVWLADADPAHVRTAAGLGAGLPDPGGDPVISIVAVPPDAIVETIERLLSERTGWVTDAGSVKASIATSLADRPDAARYVGSHPMAGSERSGPLAASDSLFDGRPWAITPHPTSDAAATAAAEAVAEACGAVITRLTPEAHDVAVAKVSHLPQLMSALTASRLTDADPVELGLSGQGVRDVTRIAASDPQLWRQIIGANREAVADQLRQVRDQLEVLLAGLDDPDALTEVLATGVAGAGRIPGKHGLSPVPTEMVYVALPDHPGELARLFHDVGEIGVNIEDVRIDHDPGREVGLVELSIRESAADGLREALEARDWVVHR